MTETGSGVATPPQADIHCGQLRDTAPGADAALVGHRVSDDWVDLIRLEGFSRDCSAWREWTSSLIISPDELGQRQHRVQGSAVQVLNEVLTGEPSP
ncbi:MAG: hypothetical protein ACRDQ4_05770 [Pseudonocardiaceae bacterium]